MCRQDLAELALADEGVSADQRKFVLLNMPTKPSE
jgi:hypothetical protein